MLRTVVTVITLGLSSASLAQDAEAKPADGEAPAPDAPAAEPSKAEETCQVAVMNLIPKGLPEDQKHIPELLTDSMAAEIASTTKCKVITQSDIVQMLDFEATKAACSDEAESCLAEVGGALGVDRVIGGTVGMLGSSFKVSIKLQNVAKGQTEGRVDRLIKGEPELLDTAARNAGRKLFGVELLPEGNDDAAKSGEASGAASAQSNGAAGGDGGGVAPSEDEGGGGIWGYTFLGIGIFNVLVAGVATVGGLVLAGGSEYMASTPGALGLSGDARGTLVLPVLAGGGILVATGAVTGLVGVACVGASFAFE